MAHWYYISVFYLCDTSIYKWHTGTTYLFSTCVILLYTNGALVLHICFLNVRHFYIEMARWYLRSVLFIGQPRVTNLLSNFTSTSFRCGAISQFEFNVILAIEVSTDTTHLELQRIQDITFVSTTDDVYDTSA